MKKRMHLVWGDGLTQQGAEKLKAAVEEKLEHPEDSVLVSNFKVNWVTVSVDEGEEIQVLKEGERPWADGMVEACRKSHEQCMVCNHTNETCALGRMLKLYDQRVAELRVKLAEAVAFVETVGSRTDQVQIDLVKRWRDALGEQSPSA